MTFSQQGDNAAANFDTYNDVQGNQANIVNQYNGPIYIMANQRALALWDDDSVYGLPLEPKGNDYHQQWRLELADNGNVSIRSEVNGKYVGVKESNVDAKLIGVEKGLSWRITEENGSYRIVEPATGLSLDLGDDATLQTSQDIPSQKMTVRKQADPTPPPTPTPQSPSKLTPETPTAPPIFDLFIVGKDSAIYHKTSDGSSWYPPDSQWENIGGRFVHETAAVSWGPNRVDVFAIGIDCSLYHKAWDVDTWGVWDDLGGTWMEKPTAVSWGPNRLDVFVIGTDRALYHKYWDGEIWNIGFHCLGGRWLHAPSVVSFGSNRIDIFATGTDSSVYQKTWLNGAWYPPNDQFFHIGGVVLGAPKAAVQHWETEGVDIFAVGINSELLHKYWIKDKGWFPSQYGWEGMNAQCRFPPDVISQEPKRLDIFYVGLKHTVYHKRHDSSAGWLPSSTGDESKGSNAILRNIAAIFFPGRIGIFGIGEDGKVLHKSWSPYSSKTPSLLHYKDLGGNSVSSVNAVVRVPKEHIDTHLKCESCGRIDEVRAPKRPVEHPQIPRRRVQSVAPPAHPDSLRTSQNQTYPHGRLSHMVNAFAPRR